MLNIGCLCIDIICKLRLNCDGYIGGMISYVLRWWFKIGKTYCEFKHLYGGRSTKPIPDTVPHIRPFFLCWTYLILQHQIEKTCLIPWLRCLIFHASFSLSFPWAHLCHPYQCTRKAPPRQRLCTLIYPHCHRQGIGSTPARKAAMFFHIKKHNLPNPTKWANQQRWTSYAQQDIHQNNTW